MRVSEMRRDVARADDLIDVAEAARIAGVKPSTWRAYVSLAKDGRGTAPQPRQRFGQSPVWVRADVIAWHASRPGSGNRTPRS